LAKKKFEDFYGITLEETDTTEELIQKVGIKYGRLRAGGKGEINEDEVAKLIIRDWQNNRLKFYLLPPGWDEKEELLNAVLSPIDTELLTHTGVEIPIDEIGPSKKGHSQGSHAGKKGAYRTGR
jgi:ribosome biogenesis GTPase A